jgi:hypothetical protein
VRYLAIYLSCLALLAPGCARNTQTEAAATLAGGISALQVGDYLRAEEQCLVVSKSVATNGEAHECTLMAAIHLRHWSVAAAAAEALTALIPADPWLAAVASQVHFHHDPSVQQSRRLDRPEMAWACLDSPCTTPASFEDGEMRLLATLQLVYVGDLTRALALSATAEAGSQLALVHLLLLTRAEDFAVLRLALAEIACSPADNAGVVTHLRASFAPDVPIPEGCSRPPPTAAHHGPFAAADMNFALAAMRGGDYAAAATWLARCTSMSPGADLPLLYAAVNAILAQDDATARQHLLDLPPDLPSTWRDWLRKLPHRRLL